MRCSASSLFRDIVIFSVEVELERVEYFPLCRQEELGALGDMLLEEVGSRGGGLGSGGRGDLGLGHGVLEDLQKIDGGHGGGGG